MFFDRMPSAASDGFNLYNKKGIIRERDDDTTGWIV